jgi:anti-sigma factor RsiW
MNRFSAMEAELEDHMQHLDEGTIHAWLDQALPPDERARAEAHVRVCVECAAMVAEARGMIAGASRIVSALDAVPAGVIPRAKPAASQPGSLWRAMRVTPARAALAASLLLAVATMLTVRHDTPDKIVPAVVSRVRAAPAPAAPSKVPVTDAVASPPATKPRPPHSPRVAQNKPAAAPATDSSQLDALAETRNATRSTLGGVARQAAVPRAMQLQSLVGASAPGERRDLAGCYQIARDSVEWLRSIPERFALALTPGRADPAQHVVRAIAADGRMDSVLTQSSWREVGPTLALVTFSLPEGRRVLTVQLAAGGTFSAQSALASGGFVPVRIMQATCTP